MTQNAERLDDYAEAIQKSRPRTEIHNTRTDVYRLGAPLYRAAGWLGVLPVPHGRKDPVPAGFTGAGGRWPTDDEIAGWTYTHARCNLALRLPDDVIGIDLDAYKPAAISTITDAVDSCGPLPETWRSSARYDGLSGIYLYRVPTDIAWKSELGPGVEIIRCGHRYAVAWPSIHPHGWAYRWWHDGGFGVPRPKELSELPEAWIAELTDTARRGRGARSGKGVAPVAYDLDDAMTPGRPLFLVGKRLRQAVADLSGAGCRHDTTCRHVLALLGLGSRRQPGVAAALEHLRDEFVSAVGPDRDGGYGAAAAEFDRMVAGAGRRIGATR